MYRPARDFEVVSFDGATTGRFLVVAEGHRWLLSAEALALLQAASIGGTAAQIAERLSADTGREFAAPAVHAAIQSNLVSLGLLSDASIPEVALRRDSPLIVRVSLVNATRVQWMADRLSLLIPRARTFWITLMAGLALTTLIFGLTLVAPGRMPFDNGRITWAAIIVAILSTFAHELGHASACAKGGARCGEIGFGMYWYFPVLYSNLDDAWRLPRMERARVDAAGLYFQVGFILIVGLVVSLCTAGTSTLSGLPLLLFGSVAYTCNPLLRFDGYWLVTDLTGIPNLRAASQDELRRRLGRRDHGAAGGVSRPRLSSTSVNRSTALAGYAVVSAGYGLLLSVAGVQLLHRWYLSDLRMSASSILPPVIGCLLLYGSFRATASFFVRVLR